MAGFGGAVKLTGESEYRKALSQITQSLKVVSSEMKATSSSFASGEKSEAELAQSAGELSKALNVQKQALSTLKAQLATMQSEYNKSGAAHQQLVEKYESEKTKLEQIKNTLGASSAEYKEQEKVVGDLALEVAQSEKAYESQGKALNDMRIKTANAETTVNQTSQALDKLGNEAEDSGKSAEKAGGGFTVMKGVLANLATDVIQNAIGGLKNLGGELINVGKQAMSGFGEFEQLEGGVNKLFGEESAKTVMDNANKAFSSAGMSANEYMNAVTGFSASLISGLNGDTAQASKIADQAIRDMADNANTFGTDIESIQTAYQGFAKGNFQLLDNLKLGYGGTKEEMLRLVKDAGVVDDSVKSINDVSFDQIIEGISITQQRMGIAGTTAKEASGTIEGSVGSMQSAWENMLTGMANENADFGKLATDFVNTLVSPDGKGGVLGTIVPRISQVVTGMASALETTLPKLINQVVPIIQENLPVIISAVQQALQTVLKLLPSVMPVIAELIPQIVSTLIALLPDIVSAGMQMITSLIQGLTDAIPQLIAMLPDIINSIVTVLIENLPLIIDAGMQLLMGIIDGLTKAIPKLIDYLPQIIKTIVQVLIKNLPQIIKSGIKVIVSLIKGLTDAIPQLVEMIPTIISTIASTLAEHFDDIISKGKDIIKSLIEGLKDKFETLKKNAGKIVDTVTDAIKDLPNKMLDVGKNIVEGIWSGISGGLDWIKRKISGWVGNVTSFIKGLFGIKSPSKLMRDEVGKNLALGIGEGFSDEMKYVATEMGNAIPTSFDVNSSVAGARYANGGSQIDMISAFKQALSQVKIVLDDEVAGEFVERTVTRVIYA